MTPQQITDYRREWMVNHGGYGVNIHSDIRSDAKKQIKEYGTHKTSYARYTDVYQDTIYFQDQADAESFYEWYRERFSKAPPLELIVHEQIGTLNANL